MKISTGRKMLFYKALYVFSWALVSLVSSYNSILDFNFDFISNGDFYKDIIAPLLVWTLAFFVDYIYTISMINNDNEELDGKWTRWPYTSIGFVFFVLLISIFHQESPYIKTIWIVCMFYSIISLKTASLNIVRPVINMKPV